MGNSSRKQKHSRKVKDIDKHYRRYRNIVDGRIRIAICGSSQSVKSTIMNEIMRLHENIKIQNFIQCKYHVTSEYRIHEYCYPTITSLKNVKYLSFFCLRDEGIFERKDKYNVSELELTDLIKAHEYVTHGYIRKINEKTTYNLRHIIKLIYDFYCLPIEIESYVVQKDPHSYELITITNLINDTLEKLYKFVDFHVMVFMVDLCVYDQYDGFTNMNKLDSIINSFGKIVNSEYTNTSASIIFLNNYENFKHKIENNMMNIKCEALKDFEEDTYINAIDCIKNRFREIDSNRKIQFFHVTGAKKDINGFDKMLKMAFHVALEKAAGFS